MLEDIVAFAKNQQIDDFAFEQIIRGLENTAFFAFRQYDGRAGLLGAMQQFVLERVRRGGRGEGRVDCRPNLVGGSVVAECFERALCGIVMLGIGEIDRGNRPHRNIEPGQGLTRIRRFLGRAAGHEHADDSRAAVFDRLTAGFDGCEHFLAIASHRAHRQEHRGFEVGGDIDVKFEAVRIEHVGGVGADDDHGFRVAGFHRVVVCGDDVGADALRVFARILGAHSTHIVKTLTSIRRFDKGLRDGAFSTCDRTEHPGACHGGQGVKHPIRHDVAAVAAFWACDINHSFRHTAP